MKNKILIVDDSEDVREILEKRLKKSGFEVVLASSGKEAVGLCDYIVPDAIILDIVLSDTDGFTVAQNIRESKNLKITPIIFMTGKDLDFPSMSKTFDSLGHCDFIAKPCEFEELLSKLKKTLG
jgi:DNA-binding response OmpR family regulator